MDLKILFLCAIVLLLLVNNPVLSKKSKKKTKGSHTHSHSHSRSEKTSKTVTPSANNPDDQPSTDQSTINAAPSDSNSAPQRPGATIVLSSSGEIVPSYTQLTSSQITTSSGLQCNGDTGSTSATWMLPNGQTLEDSSSSSSVNLMVQTNPSLTNANVELLRSDAANPLGIEGVFWCIVEYNGYTDMFPVWIVEDSAPPSVMSSSCEFVGFNPSDDTIGVYLSANISNGAPTEVSCSVGVEGDSLSISTFRQVFDTVVPTEAGIRIATNVPLNSVPGSLTCTISNSGGSDSFSCAVQATTLGVPVIDEIVRDSDDISVVTVAWGSISIPDNDLDSYMVYVTSTNGKVYIPFRKIEVIGTQARISGLYPGFSYRVFVTAVSSSLSISSNQIILPSISAAGTITMSQCKPAQGQNVEIKLTKLNNCQDVDDCSEITASETNQELARAALATCGTGQWNCTAMEPKITKVYCRENKENTRKKNSKSSSKSKSSKIYEDISIKAMAVCNACDIGGSSDYIENTRHTHRHDHTQRGKRSRLLRQIIDNTECVMMYDGCEYAVTIDTKYGPERLCGYSSARSNQDTCDCPEQCYHRYTETCQNSCSCSSI